MIKLALFGLGFLSTGTLARRIPNLPAPEITVYGCGINVKWSKPQRTVQEVISYRISALTRGTEWKYKEVPINLTPHEHFHHFNVNMVTMSPFFVKNKEEMCFKVTPEYEEGMGHSSTSTCIVLRLNQQCFDQTIYELDFSEEVSMLSSTATEKPCSLLNPSPPTVSSKGNSVVLEWEPQQGAMMYIIYARRNKEPWNKLTVTASTSYTMYGMVMMSEGVDVRVQYRAMCGESPFSAPVNLQDGLRNPKPKAKEQKPQRYRNMERRRTTNQNHRPKAQVMPVYPQRNQRKVQNVPVYNSGKGPVYPANRGPKAVEVPVYSASKGPVYPANSGPKVPVYRPGQGPVYPSNRGPDIPTYPAGSPEKATPVKATPIPVKKPDLQSFKIDTSARWGSMPTYPLAPETVPEPVVETPKPVAPVTPSQHSHTENPAGKHAHGSANHHAHDTPMMPKEMPFIANNSPFPSEPRNQQTPHDHRQSQVQQPTPPQPKPAKKPQVYVYQGSWSSDTAAAAVPVPATPNYQRPPPSSPPKFDFNNPDPATRGFTAPNPATNGFFPQPTGNQVLENLRKKAVAYSTVRVLEQIYSKLAKQSEKSIGKTNGIVSETLIQITSVLQDMEKKAQETAQRAEMTVTPQMKQGLAPSIDKIRDTILEGTFSKPEEPCPVQVNKKYFECIKMNEGAVKKACLKELQELRTKCSNVEQVPLLQENSIHV